MLLSSCAGNEELADFAGANATASSSSAVSTSPTSSGGYANAPASTVSPPPAATSTPLAPSSPNAPTASNPVPPAADKRACRARCRRLPAARDKVGRQTTVSAGDSSAETGGAGDNADSSGGAAAGSGGTSENSGSANGGSAGEENTGGTPQLPSGPLTVYIAGDSTVSTYNDTASTTDQADWGQVLGEYFSTDVTIENRAIGGRTARRCRHCRS